MKLDTLPSTKDIEYFIQKYWKYILIVLILVSLFLPLVENIKYPQLTSYDTWNFLSFGTQIIENNGIPIWQYMDHFPDGRPFLYPPLVPLLLAVFSIISSVNLYSIIKISTIIMYPLYILGAIFLATKITDSDKKREVTLLSAVILLAFVQSYVNSVNSLSQIMEILLIYLLIYFIYKKKFYTIPIILGTMFFTHFFTPFLSFLGIIGCGIFSEDKSVRKKLFLGAILGLFIGCIWLIRYYLFSGYIHMNTHMPEHFILNSYFIWRFVIEGPTFLIVLITIFVLYFTSNKKVRKEVTSNKLNQILIVFLIAFIPAFIYPERAVTYVAPFISIICAQLILKSKVYQLKIVSLFLSIPLFIVIIYYIMGPKIFTTEYSMFSYIIIFLFIFVLIAMFSNKIKITKGIFLVIFVLLLFTYTDTNTVVPFLSWYSPAVIDEKANLYALDAVDWIAENNPDAIVATDCYKTAGYLVYKRIKTPTYVVMEFSKTGALTQTAMATHFISVYNSGPSNSIYIDFFGDEKYKLVWQKNGIKIFEKTTEKQV